MTHISQDGWSAWTSGPRPVGPDELIQVEYGPLHAWPGDISSFAPASVWSDWYWEQAGHITRWRPATPQRIDEYGAIQAELLKQMGGE